MADEISLTATLAVNKDYLNSRQQISRSFTLLAGSPAVASGVASIGTTHEAIPMGDVGTPGWSWVENLDPTNYVEIGIVVSATFYPFLKLLPGEGHPVRLGTAAPYAKANTAAVKLSYTINEA